MPKKIAKPKISGNEDLKNLVSLNHFKMLEKQEIDKKENQHDKQEDLISPFAYQLQGCKQRMRKYYHQTCETSKTDCCLTLFWGRYESLKKSYTRKITSENYNSCR